MNKLELFLNDESGAVTVDWVVLTAAVVGLAIGVMATITSNTDSLAGNIASAIGNVTVEGVEGGGEGDGGDAPICPSGMVWNEEISLCDLPS